MTATKQKASAKKVTKAPAKQAATPDVNADACPAGGDHKFVDDGDGIACEKCLEPGGDPPKKKRASKASTTKAPAKPKAKPGAKEKKLSALDAAAKVLAHSKEPMTTREMIEAMAAKGLWASPGGKTPAATLYSAILREIGTKGAESRFVKSERGKFAAK